MTDNYQVKNKGIRLGKNQSALEALQNALPHWIHEKIEDPTSVTGFMYARQCTCSACGYKASFEKEFCPHCRAKMKRLRGL
ncbi:MAG: hypothetical protein IKG15_00210 [Solobacterium sp.]|jgi:hypothetical protein|nr:hypothetical protein [Solobacterium sp.]